MGRWPRRFRLPAALVLCCLAATAVAQTPDIQLAPSPAVRCLTPAEDERGEPEYPFAPWKRGEGGEVRVELIFTGATLAPEVKVLSAQGDDDFVAAVKAHVRRFRVPCIEDSDVPVRLAQIYVFVHEKKLVNWSAPDDLADVERRQMLQCMAAQDGSKSPVYPRWAREDGVQGNVLAQLRFTAPDRPPAITLYTTGRTGRDLGVSVRDWAQKLRMPCLTGKPVESVVIFKFRLEGEPPFGFRPFELRQFLALVKNRERLDARFDTRDMGCPFDVALTYRQPHLSNLLGEFGPPRLERRPLLDWLSKLELNFTKQSDLDATLGDTTNIAIPCVVINLIPQEKKP